MKMPRWDLIPSTVHASGRCLPLIPFFLLLVWTAVELPRLGVNGNVGQRLPEGDGLRAEAESVAGHFPPYDFAVLSIESPGADERGAIAAVRRLSGLLRETAGVSAVLSVATVQDIRVIGEELSFVPLLGDGDPRRIREDVGRTPLFRDWLLSMDGKAFSVYAFLEPDADRKTVMRAVEALGGREKEARVSVFGSRAMELYIESNVVGDLVVLGSIALLLILLFEAAATRSLLRGLALWTTSLFPAVWVLALYPSLGLELELSTIVAPLIVLALSTSYSIHLYRAYSRDPDRGMAAALDEITPVVFSAGFTTVLGFLSLLVSSLASLRILGLLLVVGIILAILSSLFLLPLLLGPMRPSEDRGLRSARALHAMTRRPSVLLVFGLCVALAALGLPRVRSDYRLGSLLSGRTAMARTIAYFTERYGGMSSLEAVLDTRREYGLTDADAFRRLAAFREEIGRAPGVSRVICITDFVQWVNDRLAGGTPRTGETSAAEIGEALELLCGESSGLGIDGLIDPSYARTRILIMLSTDRSGPAESRNALLGVEQKVREGLRERFPEAAVAVAGTPLVYERILLYLVRSQISGILLYLLLSFLFVWRFFRSWRWALLSLIPPFTGVVFYLGVMGWAHVSLNAISVMAIAAVMGVGIDDVLCLIGFYRLRPEAPVEAMGEVLRTAGSAILQTTFVIVLALGALLVSRYNAFVSAALLMAGSFLLSTAVTLIVVPHLVMRFSGKLD